MTDGKTINLNTAAPGVFKALDSVWRENEIKIEGAVFQLHEVLTTPNLLALVLCQSKSEFQQRRHNGGAILVRLLNEEICILSRVGIAQ